MLAAQWPENPDIRRITVISRFQTRNRRVDLDQPAPANFRPESAATLREYLKPTDLLPTDGIVKATADRITRGHSGDLARALAIYEWVVENTCRTASTRGCGVGDVRYMLTANDLNGKCADINALFVALARAAGIPARDAYGLRVAGRNWATEAWARPATSPAPSTAAPSSTPPATAGCRSTRPTCAR